ncbi:MAG: GNAT family N-acetyltransferase [Marmoricola sp.]
MDASVSPATHVDLGSIAAIYDHEVTHSIATFDTEPQGAMPWRERLDAGPGNHLLVARHDARVVGFAYSGPFRSRPAYRHTRETSVYLAAGARGHGLGRSLYADLLDRLDADGIHRVLAVIALPNDASRALHVACGFTRCALLTEVGRKFGRWVDVSLWERALP